MIKIDPSTLPDSIDKDDPFFGMGVEVSFTENQSVEEVKEILSRTGMVGRKGTTAEPDRLTQSCHLVTIDGRHAIMHFLEIFEMQRIADERTVNEYALTYKDELRRNIIATLLNRWGHLQILDPEHPEFPEDVREQLRRTFLQFMPKRVVADNAMRLISKVDTSAIEMAA